MEYLASKWLRVLSSTLLFGTGLTGFYFIHLAGFDWHHAWIAWSIVLYVIAAACWLPVMWMHIRMRDMAAAAARDGTVLPPLHGRYLRIQVALGLIAFLALLLVFILMVVKPA